METNIGKVGIGMALITAGAALGAGTALLLAPRSGVETRRDIRRIARKTANAASSAADAVVDTLEKTRERLAKIAG